MAMVQESRPGQSIQIELGASYAQPSASEHANWYGQTTRQLAWSGERNAGQPLYDATDPSANVTEVEARLRSASGEALESWRRENTSLLASMGLGEEEYLQMSMQLYSMNFS